MTLRSFAASAAFRFVLPSSLLHGASLAWLMTQTWVTPRLPEPVHVVELAALPPPPPEPPQLPEPEPEPEPESKAKPAPAPSEPVPPRKAERTPPPAESVAEASEPTGPIRLGAVGLSNVGLAVGSAGPATLTAATRAPAPAKPKPVSRPVAPGLVPLADLSRKPLAPSFDGQLRSNYPHTLRRQGVEGEALVRLTLAADGNVTAVASLSSSHPEFGEACRRTLLGSRWSAPLDQLGRPVATQLTYRCRFQVAF
jgi:TonB family protein